MKAGPVDGPFVWLRAGADRRYNKAWEQRQAGRLPYKTRQIPKHADRAAWLQGGDGQGIGY